ncbi:MAG: serine/threonine-protein kinase, partial [Acidobacteriota bacterium]
MKIGDRIGNIRIVKRLGQGGMGEVFEGFDERLLRRVAVKALNPGSFASEDSRARFLREAQVLSRLDHANICRIHGLEETPENDFLILELLEGRTLSEIPQEDLSREERLRCAQGIAEALHAAHQEGIIHRDLKPENVMVVGADRVKVLDFGIARLLDQPIEVDDKDLTQGPASTPSPSSTPTEVIRRPATGSERLTASWTASSSSGAALTKQGFLVGTPAYMSPEQAGGAELTQASDLYSLGILLQELFSGSPAYDPAPTPVARIVQVAEGDSRPMEDGDPAVVQLIKDLKSLDPADRPTA